MIRMTMVLLALGGMLEAQTYTRGVGVYPGDPSQDFAARLAYCCG